MVNNVFGIFISFLKEENLNNFRAQKEKSFEFELSFICQGCGLLRGHQGNRNIFFKKWEIKTY